MIDRSELRDGEGAWSRAGLEGSGGGALLRLESGVAVGGASLRAWSREGLGGRR